MSLKDDYVEIVSVVEDPFIVSVPGFITAPRPIFFYFPVILLTFFFYIFLSKVEIETIRTIFLPQRKLRPDMTVIAPLDGLRGIAALLVVADHTWPWFLGAGASGVHIFFVLSGFLLCRPFVSNPGMVSSVESWVRYGARRLRRILPMYYLYLFLTFGMSLRLYELYLHVFFIEAKGHLWAIPQEMVFYTVFPVIALLNYFVLRSKIFLIIPSLLLMVFLWGKFVTIKYVYLFGMMNSRLPFRLDVFLIGVVFSYLYFAVWVNTANIKMSTVLKNSLTVVGVALLALFVFFSNGHLFHNNLIYSQIYSLYFAIGAGMLVFFLSCSGENLLTKWLSSSLLSSLGIVSYSLYLFHPLIIAFVKQVGGKTLNSLFGVRFVLVLSISYFVACLLYHFIERPLLGCVVKKKIPGVANQCS